MIPSSIREEAVSILSEKSGENVAIEHIASLSGGDINAAFRLETTIGTFFIKYNRSEAYPAMFEREARGLSLLYDAGEVRIPEVLGTGDDGRHAFILLEYIASAAMKHGFWEGFGKKLAALHRHHGDRFGLDHDNYIGSLKQYNDPSGSWTDFFRDRRLRVQMELAASSGLLPSSVQKSFEGLFGRLDDIFPDEPPCLIHGDLWSGNYMVDDRGEACIIDPAVYYGCREMDIGMSRLFGGFSPEFYRAYQEAWPMEPGWEERADICNLYPLMVHVNLFGQGYLGSVESILRKF
jgi:fructosamine-3-kinase